MDDGPGSISRLLQRSCAGDAEATSALWTRVDDEVRSLAARRMNGEKARHLLQATALANEVFLRLGQGSPVAWRNRAHFFGAVGRAMRRILVEHARRANGKEQPLSADKLQRLAAADADSASPDLNLDHVLQATDALAQAHPRAHATLNLSVFAGRTIAEIASMLGVSTTTVKRDLRLARAWVTREATARSRR